MRNKSVILAGVGLLVAAGLAAIVLADGSTDSTSIRGVANSGPDAAGATYAPSAGINEAQAYDGGGDDAAEAPAGDMFLAVPAPENSDLTKTLSGIGGASGAGVDGATSPSIIDRKIIRNATLDITVEDVPAALARVTSEAGVAGGYVASSTITTEAPETEDEPARQRATVQIRVPAAAYDTVLNNLRGMAEEVTSEQSQTSEVTEEYTDLQSQIRNLQSQEEQYLLLLGQATTISDILTVTDRLNQVRPQIEQIQGRLQLLDDLTDLATITVNIGLPSVAVLVVEEEAQPNWAEEAWDDAWQASEDALREVGQTGIIAGVVLIWILIPAALLGVAWWIFGGRRRDAASSA